MLESHQQDLRIASRRKDTIPQHCMSEPEYTVNTQALVEARPSTQCVEHTQPLVS